MSKHLKWISAACALSFLGCTSEWDTGDPGLTTEETQAIGEECHAANPTVVFMGGANYTSPQTYNTVNCYKAVVVDIHNYSSSFIGSGDVPGGTYINWSDAIPSTEAACNNSWVRADLFEWKNNAWQYWGLKESHGSWLSGDLFMGCLFLPGTGFTSAELQAGHTYRIAATARLAATSPAATRVVSVVSQQPQIIRCLQWFRA